MAELELTEEPVVCVKQSISFISFPISDRSVPANPELYVVLVERLFGEYSQDRHIVIHCRAGIGRASLIAAGILIRGGLSVREALDRSQQRGDARFQILATGRVA